MSSPDSALSAVDVPALRSADFVRAPAACHVSARDMRGAVPGWHTHDFPEVFWIESGTAVHLWPGGQDFLSAGDLAFVAARDVHGFRAADESGYGIFNVAFPQAHWDAFAARYGDGVPDMFDHRRPLRARTRRLDHHQRIALATIAAGLRRGPRHAAALDRFLLNLLHLLSETGAEGPPDAPAWLTRAAGRMRDNVDALHEGTPALVRLCRRSAEHVSRETRRWFGQTPTALVNAMRLDAAAAMLATTAAPVVGIAQTCGFSNVSHFYRLFEGRFGVTPGAHRLAAERVLEPRGDAAGAARRVSG